MITTSRFSEVLRGVLMHPTRGVTGLVADLLTVCQEYGLQLEWDADRCRVRSFRSDWEEWIDVPLRKSVIRAILARVAVLCIERNPDSVSLYGGQGELSAGTNPSALFRVVFLNTPSEQKLELSLKDPSASGSSP
jgi:hypothetical protein